MKYDKIDHNLFILNRRNLSKQLKNKSLAIILSNHEYLRSGDQAYNFKQNADLFYLCGIDQEDTILLLFPDFHLKSYREILFIKETNAEISLWEGKKLDKLAAKEHSGIATIFWLSDFDKVLNSVIYYTDNIYLNTNENERSGNNIFDANFSFIKEIKNKFPLHQYLRLAPILKKLRPIKSDIEIELTKKACEITKKAFIQVLKFTKPLVGEYEIEAEIIHQFIKNRATGHAYAPIIASGKNACILHYNDNNQICNSGDVILMDFGAEYANYNADLSRSIPVNGKFTDRQKAVYNAVLKVMKEAKKLLISGTLWNEYQEEVGKIMTHELIKLKLLSKHEVKKQDTKSPLYKKYFMHGTSHHLGLDVHDLASRYEPFAEGNILTCEPGIYIAEENLGIRLENNILLTKNGNIDLMADIPIEIEEIEDLMNNAY